MTSDLDSTRQGRWPLVMAIFSALSLLTCAAFADKAAHKLGGPSAVVIYIVCGIAGILVVALYLGSGVSRSLYRWLALGHTLLLLGLTGYACSFVVADAKGGPMAADPTFIVPPTPPAQVTASIAIFAVFCVLAIVAAWRMVAVLRVET